MFSCKAFLREDELSPRWERLPFIWTAPASAQQALLASGPTLASLDIYSHRKETVPALKEFKSSSDS